MLHLGDSVHMYAHMCRMLCTTVPYLRMACCAQWKLQKRTSVPCFNWQAQ